MQTMNILNTNWYLVATLAVILTGVIIDNRRLKKENLLLMADPDTIIGIGIIKAFQSGESFKSIVSQIRQMNIDDSRQVAKVYGNSYEDLLKLLK